MGGWFEVNIILFRLFVCYLIYICGKTESMVAINYTSNCVWGAGGGRMG